MTATNCGVDPGLGAVGSDNLETIQETETHEENNNKETKEDDKEALEYDKKTKAYREWL